VQLSAVVWGSPAPGAPLGYKAHAVAAALGAAPFDDDPFGVLGPIPVSAAETVEGLDARTHTVTGSFSPSALFLVLRRSCFAISASRMS